MWSRKKKNCPHNTSRETGHEEENKWRLMAQTNCNNKYGHAAENTHSYIMNGDLGRTFAICNENRKHASEMPAMLWVWWHFTPLPPGAVCSADSHAASFLPHAGCAFSVLDDLCSCLGVIKHICVLCFFWKGKETFSNWRKPENMEAFTELTRPALQCTVPVFMCETNSHNKTF